MRTASRPLSRLVALAILIQGVFVLQPAAAADNSRWLEVARVETQPLASATERLVQALEFVGAPLSAEQQRLVREALSDPQPALATERLQKVLDPLCLAGVRINPESRVTVHEGPAKKELIQQGWRTFLLKVHNEGGVTAPLVPESVNLLPVYQRGSKNNRERPATDEPLVKPEDVPQRFLDAILFDNQPLKPQLSGLELEYRIVQLYSRDAGPREAQLGFHVGQGTQDLGFRNTTPILFQCLPAIEVTLRVQDQDGSPTTAAFTIRDDRGRVYPNPARRLAPDFFFHEQIYRADGETVSLPPGQYQITVQRGPEYHVQTLPLTVTAAPARQEFAVKLQRWIHAAKRGWYSGDHHVHAAGCAHYDSPTEGVGPADMMRHLLGEDLNVGCVLSWGPCWYTQKRYFEGKTSALSRPNYLMRYDVEVSGFPSSHAGHLCLLKLQEDDYPGTQLLEEWPSWTLPILKWGQQQGGVVGYSHSGWGLALPDVMPNGERRFLDQPWGGAPPGWNGRASDQLPDQALPRYDSIGANEFIVTTALDACDFISAVDTPAIWELNIWYHTLNAGMRTRISGETDFPCIYGDKVGLGRIYVKQPANAPLDYDRWVEGVRDGRSYCGDGLSHLFDFRVNDFEVGTRSGQRPASEYPLSKAGPVTIRCTAAALLQPTPDEGTEAIRTRRLDQKPYWHLERCRVEQTRRVPVELVVNGTAVARQEIVADGSLHELEFPLQLQHSSWVALRILPSCHTNPVFVVVNDEPIRASRKSAEWCAASVDICWKSKAPLIREKERPAAKAAYDQARQIYEAAAKAARGD